MAKNTCNYCQSKSIGEFPLFEKDDESRQDQGYSTADESVIKEFNLGNNQRIQKQGVALNKKLLEFCPELHEVMMNSRKFVPGYIGVKFVPQVIGSKIPTTTYRKSRLNLDQKATDTSKKEEAEFTLYDGLKNYFTKDCQEREDRDTVVFYGVELEDPNVPTKINKNNKKTNVRKPEKDFVIVDLTHGNIVGIEVKYELHRSAFKKAVKQLKNTKDIIQTMYRGKLQKDWTFISVVFGMVDTKEYLCDHHRQYVLTSYNLEGSLEKILRNGKVNKNKNPLWIKDFILMVRDLIPKKVAMPDEIIDLISNNLERASSDNTILRFAFWTPEQYSFITFYENNKRVIFTSSPSTGKTILMMNSASKLLMEGEIVLILFYRKLSENIKSFLQMEIESYFHEHIVEGKCLVKTFNEKDKWSSILKPYSTDYNIFIDELIFQDEHITNTNDESINATNRGINDLKKEANILRARKLPEFDAPATRFLDWHEKHNPNKYLWIVITGTYYGYQEIDK